MVNHPTQAVQMACAKGAGGYNGTMTAMHQAQVRSRHIERSHLEQRELRFLQRVDDHAASATTHWLLLLRVWSCPVRDRSNSAFAVAPSDSGDSASGWQQTNPLRAGSGSVPRVCSWVGVAAAVLAQHENRVRIRTCRCLHAHHGQYPPEETGKLRGGRRSLSAAEMSA